MRCNKGRRGPSGVATWRAFRRFLLLRLRGAELVVGISIIVGTDEGDYFPEVVGVLDDGSHGRHRTHDVLVAGARIAFLLQRIAAESDQPKQSVVIAAVHPGVVGHRRAHAAAARTAVAPAAAIASKQRLALRHDVRLSILVWVAGLSLRSWLL